SQGITTSAENIRAILESDFCPKVNPVQEYFHSLPEWDENRTSEIVRLAECVTVRSPEKWRQY
ncbi:MAG TPA: virulence protein, partial [Bacteroidales bacterium]|nr:virulence protein [Bacteroidales bacterium]